MDPKQQKAEELGNSRPLFMWRLSDHPEAKDAVDCIFSELDRAGLIKQRYRSKWRDLTRAIVLDLFVANKTDPAMYIAYARDPNRYREKSRYGAWFLSGTILVQLVDYLAANGYIEHHTGFHTEAKVRLSRMRATDKLLGVAQCVTLPMIGHNSDEQVIILRNESKVDVEYEDTAEVIQMRENLQRINRALASHAILLNIKDEELKKLQDRLNHKIDFADKRLRRVFNNCSWDKGGRFYGGWWQNVPREYRKFIRINDKDVVECDYSGLHINMLYAASNIPMPDGDVYHLPGYTNDPIFRAFVKRMLLILVNSADRDKARRALHSEVHHDRTLTLPEQIPSTSAEHLNPLMDAFEAKHHPIRHFFCTGVGIDLQNKDAQIAEQVLLHFAGPTLAILPLHDSFIIHHGLEAELKKVMNKAFKAQFGTNAKVDLKFNSLRIPGEDEEDSDQECNLTLRQLVELRAPYGTYESLLDEHRRLSYLPRPA